MRQSLKFIFIILIVLSCSLILYWRFMAVPKYEGVQTNLKLKKEVEVSFDQFGVPHISASSKSDAFYSLGYVMASERLFQMDLTRRLAKGTLSELFGEKTIEVDKLFRTLGLNHHFQERIRSLPSTKSYVSSMRSFYDGVNEFIRSNQLPREYQLLRLNPEFFSIDDAYAIVGYMAYTFAMGLKTDLLYQEVLDKEGREFVNQLRIRPVAVKERTVQSINKQRHDYKKTISPFERAQQWIEDNLSPFTGSNGWVLSPLRTKSGGAILANDPHVRLNSPGLWYEAFMKWDGGEVYGHFVPGVPFAALGHNRKLSWGMTISYVDDMDFYQEKRQGDEVYYNNEWVSLNIRKEIIRVKGARPVEHSVAIGPHGPLIDGLTRLKTKPGQSVSLSWSHYHPNNQPARAFYGMMMARSRKEFKKALSHGKSPGLNVLYADASGNIGRYLYGGFPLRPDYMVGDLVYPGDDGRYEWEGELDFFDRSHIENPDSGVIVSANQRIEAPADHIRGYYQPNDRYTTIHEILAAKEKWSVDELKFVQTSNSNIFNGVFLRKFLAVLSQSRFEGKYLDAFKVLKSWDGQSPVGSAGSLIYHQLFFELERNLLAPELLKYYKRICELTSFWHQTKNKILKGIAAPSIENSFRQAVDKLNELYGPVNSWRWGRAHQLELVHPLGKSSKLLAKLFNFGPFEVPGGYNHINNLRRADCEHSFSVEVGPSTRRIVDMSKPELSYGILPMGNSSHLYSPFYSDQFALFSSGKYRTQSMRLSDSDIFGKLILKP